MVLYLCDCRMPCATEVGCYKNDSAVGFCKHTTKPEHAMNGICEDPQNHPERFEPIRDKRTGVIVDYFEMDGEA